MPFDDYYRGPRHVSRHSTYTLIAARPRSLARGCYLPIHTERRTPVLVHLPLRSRGVRDSGTQQRRLSYRRANKSKRKSAVGSLFDATMPWDEKPVFFSPFFFLLCTKFHPAFVIFAAIAGVFNCVRSFCHALRWTASIE